MKQEELKQILDLKHKIEISEVSRLTGFSESEIIRLYNGYIYANYSLKDGIFTKKRPDIDNSTYKIENNKEQIKFLLKGDTHLCSVHDRVDLSKVLEEIAYEENIDYVLDCGDLCNGPLKYGNDPVKINDYNGQLQYMKEYIPKFDVPQLIISGNHDDKWYEKEEKIILKELSKEIKNLIYLGTSKRDILVGNINIKLLHGNLNINGEYFSRYNKIQLYREASFVHMGHLHYLENFDLNDIKYFRTGMLRNMNEYEMENFTYKNKGVYVVTVNLDDNQNVKEITHKQKILI